MAPPPAAALALLGTWALLVVWITSTAAGAHVRADIRLESHPSDERSERPDGAPDGVSPNGEFPSMDD
ncbi:hypothetical protein [Natrinema caseinilyticum]|uniref:hypothetical protein n=1 Tax=Natrinema caseinilyticum TaxID=2961570 RepID=UPI0020C544B7|nr:hypothetical protein [Natrinema caseinilyticum]